MRRFERCVVGGSPAARSIFSAWPRSSGLRLLSGSTQVQILPRGLFGGETGRGAGTRLKRIGRPRAAGEHDLSPPPFFRRVKPRSAVIGWKPFRAARPVGQDHCSPPFSLGERIRRGADAVSKADGPAPPVEAQVLRSPPISSCSSKVEQSADNRSTPERYRARGPFFTEG